MAEKNVTEQRVINKAEKKKSGLTTDAKLNVSFK